MSIKGELFSQKFIPKLLDGSKTRTSRPVKPQPKQQTPLGFVICGGSKKDEGKFVWGQDEYGGIIDYARPKYQPGDIMYVRETWALAYENEMWKFIYKASDNSIKSGWRPSIHMPREAARLFFRVTDVKVQNIADMTEQDAVEDGFTTEYHGWSPTAGDPDSGGNGDDEPIFALDKFKEYWLKQYGPESPWMWVYYFERTLKDEALGGAKDGKTDS